MKTIRLRHRETMREVRLERGSASVDGRTGTGGLREVLLDGRRFRVDAVRAGERIWVWCEGGVYEFKTARGGRTTSAHEHGHGLGAPMPGRVRKLVAAAGSRVARGDVLLVLEAMKMEHSIRAPHDGILERFHVAEGDLVEAGVDLAELAETSSSAGA